MVTADVDGSRSLLGRGWIRTMLAYSPGMLRTRRDQQQLTITVWADSVSEAEAFGLHVMGPVIGAAAGLTIATAQL